MTASTTNTEFTTRHRSALRDILAGTFAGIGAGYRAYLTYFNLSNRSDADLAAMGISREDLPRIAAAEILDNR